MWYFYQSLREGRETEMPADIFPCSSIPDVWSVSHVVDGIDDSIAVTATRLLPPRCHWWVWREERVIEGNDWTGTSGTDSRAVAAGQKKLYSPLAHLRSRMRRQGQGTQALRIRSKSYWHRDYVQKRPDRWCPKPSPAVFTTVTFLMSCSSNPDVTRKHRNKLFSTSDFAAWIPTIQKWKSSTTTSASHWQNRSSVGSNAGSP